MKNKTYVDSQKSLASVEQSFNFWMSVSHVESLVWELSYKFFNYAIITTKSSVNSGWFILDLQNCMYMLSVDHYSLEANILIMENHHLNCGLSSANSIILNKYSCVNTNAYSFLKSTIWLSSNNVSHKVSQRHWELIL